jgi:hypothetical protein
MSDEKKERPAELETAEETVRSAGGVPVEVLFGDHGRIEISFVVVEGSDVYTFLWDRQEVSLPVLRDFVRSKKFGSE